MNKWVTVFKASLRDKTACAENFTLTQAQFLMGMSFLWQNSPSLSSPPVHHHHFPSPAQKNSKPRLAMSEGTLYINSTHISLLQKGPFCFLLHGPHKLWATVFLPFFLFLTESEVKEILAHPAEVLSVGADFPYFWAHPDLRARPIVV